MAKFNLLVWSAVGVISIFFQIISAKKGKLIKLTEDDWDHMLTGEWMVEFYAPWCAACQALQPKWESFSTWSDELNIKVAHVDVTVNPGLTGRFMVAALPTIYHIKDGEFRQYKGSREANAFVDFIEEARWKNIETVPRWKHPNSIQMSVVSYFFKISVGLRAVHNRLVQDYGIPYWGSYILFALATILLGALLGLMIVCVIDILFPFKHTSSDQDTSTGGERDSAEDLIQDAHSEQSTVTKGLRKRKGRGESGDSKDDEDVSSLESGEDEESNDQDKKKDS